MVDTYDYYLKIINQCLKESEPTIDLYFYFCLTDRSLKSMYRKMFEEITGSEKQASEIIAKILEKDNTIANRLNEKQKDLAFTMLKGFSNHLLLQSMFCEDDIILASLISAYQYPYNILHSELVQRGININKVLNYVTNILKDAYEFDMSKFYVFPAREIFEQSQISHTRKDLDELFNCKEQIENDIRKDVQKAREQVSQILSDVGIAPNSKINVVGLGGAKKTNPEDLTYEDIEPYCAILNDEVKKDKVSINFRDDEIRMIEQSLCRKNKSNVALVGEPGTGKTAIVKAFADKINKSNKSYLYNGYKIYALDHCALQAGASFRGEIENRVRDIVTFIKNDPKAILFIDEMHQISNGDKQASSVSDLLKPDLASGKLKVIGATTLDEYTTDIEKDKALNRRFVKVMVDEPDEQTTVKILNKTISLYEKFYDVKFPKDILEYIVKITNKFIFNRYQPDKSFDLIDSVGASFKIANKHDVVTIDDINNEFIKISGITLDQLKSFNEETFIANMKKKVFNQDEALQTIADALILSNSGLPTNSALSLTGLLSGPTNSGKSYIPKILAETLKIPLLRYDMCEYTESHLVHKLFGAPPGYVGHDKANGGAILLTDVDKNPRCVLLFDNIEKAHKSLLDHLAKILETGTMTTPNGKIVSFKNVIMIFTSKTDKKSNTIGFSNNEQVNNKSKLPLEVKKFIDFECELKSIKDLNSVVDMKLNDLVTFIKSKGIKFTIAKDVVPTILKVSDNDINKIDQCINKDIKLKLAKKLLTFEGKSLKLLVADKSFSIM